MKLRKSCAAYPLPPANFEGQQPKIWDFSSYVIALRCFHGFLFFSLRTHHLNRRRRCRYKPSVPNRRGIEGALSARDDRFKCRNEYLRYRNNSASLAHSLASNDTKTFGHSLERSKPNKSLYGIATCISSGLSFRLQPQQPPHKIPD